MSEQDNSVSDATNSDQAELETLREGIDDPMVLKEALKRKDESYRMIHKRAITAEQDKKELLSKLAQYESKDVTNQPLESVSSFRIDDVVELRLQGYSPQEADWIMKNGGPKVLDDKNSLVSIAINAKREQARAEQAASQTTNTAGLSEIERKYTPEQLASMSIKELEAILPKAG